MFGSILELLSKRSKDICLFFHLREDEKVGIKPMALHMVDTHSSTELHPQPKKFVFYDCKFLQSM